MSPAHESIEYAREYRGELPVKPTAWPVLIAMIVLVLAPVLFVSQITAHYRTDVVDDQMFGYFGWRIAHGATVYLDVWDNKPPGIYWINALGFLIAGGDSYGGVIALCIAAVAVALTCFLVACASLFHREAAALGTILAGFFFTHSFFQGATNRTETFLIAFEVAAVAIYIRAWAHDRWWKWLLAGMLAGGAFLFKQVGLAAWGAMGLHTIILTLTRALPMRDGVRRCLLLAGGAAITVGGASAVLAAQGAFGEATWAVFGFNKAYFEVEDSALFDNAKNQMLLKNHMVVLRLPLLMAAAACIHGFLWWARPRYRPPEIESRLEAVGPTCPRYLLLFFIWFAASHYGALLSPHGFRHYIMPTVPPLMFMSAHLLNVLTAEIGLLRRLQQRAWVAFAVVTIIYFAYDAIWWQWEGVSTVYVDRFVQDYTAEWEDVGEAVDRIAAPDEKIQVWGYMPGVYLVAKRENVCRFTTTEKIGQVGKFAARIERELTECLMQHPPPVFVINLTDFNWLHGVTPGGLMERPGPLGGWLDENYERVDEVRGTYILRRKDTLPTATGRG